MHACIEASGDWRSQTLSKSTSDSCFKFDSEPEDIVNRLCGHDTTTGKARFRTRVTDDHIFVKFLIESCYLAENIAEENEKRQCFKNIRQLCNRTQVNLLKPDMTGANIHSQGVPWVIKDFIFIFIRLINCWSLLNGYFNLINNSNTLSLIDQVLDERFLNVYHKWQFLTKDLAKQIVHIFCTLNTRLAFICFMYALFFSIFHFQLMSSYYQFNIPNPRSTHF